MLGRKYLFLISFLVLLILQSNLSYAIMIVENSAPTATILLLSKNENVVGQFAASEIQRYVQKISGATLPLVSHQVTVNSKRLTFALAILTGPEVPQQLADPNFSNDLFLSLDKSVSSIEDAYIIRVKENNILLAGSNDRGSLYAAYRFIESFGVRFFAPKFCFYNGMQKRCR